MVFVIVSSGRGDSDCSDGDTFTTGGDGVRFK